MRRSKVHTFAFNCHATLLCLVAPSRFLALAKEYDSAIAIESEPGDQTAKRAKLVRGGFWKSPGLTLSAGIVGYGLGQLLQNVAGPANSVTAMVMQLASAGIVLVATLATRGWDIQTYSGETLVEKVNQWLSRGLFVIGTFLFTLFLGWAQ
jgi:hypothetical protein